MDKNTPPRQPPEHEEHGRERLLSLPYLQNVAAGKTDGYKGPGGVTIHKKEVIDLFNLLEANAREWNHRLRIALASWIIYLQREGKLDEGYFEVVSEKLAQPPRR